MSINLISDRNTGIRAAINQSLTRQTPKSDFGPSWKATLQRKALWFRRSKVWLAVSPIRRGCRFESP